MMSSPDPSQHLGLRPPHLFSRAGLASAAIFFLCLLLAWPFAEIGINDDWVYALTTQDLARTGHFTFHGWAAPLLGWQAIWGALFIKLFGSTYTALHLSMICVSAATILLFHAILRRFGLNSAHATFGALALGLGPIFFALSGTFMTDVPSLFAILLTIYPCQLAIASPTAKGSIAWLSAAALGNIAFGTVRQIAWLGVLIIVPSCAWLLRRRRHVIAVAIALWVFALVCIRQMTHWFAHQPYTAPEVLTLGQFTPPVLLTLLAWAGRCALQIALICLPLLMLGFPATRAAWRRQWIRPAAGFGIFLIVIVGLRIAGRTHFIEPPWLGPVGDVIGLTGFMQGGSLFSSTRTVPDSVRLAVLVVFAVGVLFFAEALARFRGPSEKPEPPEDGRTALVLLIPFLIVYCLLFLASIVIVITPFDRYFLEILVVVIVFVLRWHQTRVSSRVPAPAIAMLAVFAFVAIAGTHDLFATARAEVRAANELQQAGVPRTQIQGGFAFDSVTQVQAWGYLNDPRILEPKDAFRPQPKPHPHPGINCDYSFQPWVPALHARYVIAQDPTPCLAPASFPPQSYRTWLPPATREVFIGKPVATPEDSSAPQSPTR